MSYRMVVDIGGTFTDFALFDARGARLLPRAFVWPIRPSGAANPSGVGSRSLAFSESSIATAVVTWTSSRPSWTRTSPTASPTRSSRSPGRS